MILIHETCTTKRYNEVYESFHKFIEGIPTLFQMMEYSFISRGLILPNEQLEPTFLKVMGLYRQYCGETTPSYGEIIFYTDKIIENEKS